MSWWKKLLGRRDEDAAEPTKAAAPAKPAMARWREAGETRFDVRVLDLIEVTGKLIAASSNPACAERSVSWGASTGEELDARPLDGVEGIPCELRFPAAALLPDGLLFTPRDMDDKWVVALRGDRLLLARSWTGDVVVVGELTRTREEVVIERVRTTDASGLAVLGEPIAIVDWMVRTFALGESLPLPVSTDGAAALERTPVMAFSMFGHAAACAATSWRPSVPARPLRSDGRVQRAVENADADALRRLAAAGEPLDPPSPRGGLTPLCVAALRGELAIVRLLLELGANPNARSERGMFAMGYAIVEGIGLDVLEALAAAGTDLHAVNKDGFGLLHAAAESGNADAVSWLVARGLGLETRTGRGHTAFQIACALGKLDALEALLAAGADRDATSPDGTGAEIAARENQAAVVERLSRP